MQLFVQSHLNAPKRPLDAPQTPPRNAQDVPKTLPKLTPEVRKKLYLPTQLFGLPSGSRRGTWYMRGLTWSYAYVCGHRGMYVDEGGFMWTCVDVGGRTWPLLDV